MECLFQLVNRIYSLCFLRICMVRACLVGEILSQKLQLNRIPETCLDSMWFFTLVDHADWKSQNKQRQFPSGSLVIFWLTMSSISTNKLQL